MSEYYITFDKTGKAFIAHAGFFSKRREGAKYITKVQEGNKTRYFYSKEDLERYRNNAKKAVNLIKEKRQNYKAAKKAYKNLKKQGKNLSKDNDKQIAELDKKVADMANKRVKYLESVRKVQENAKNGSPITPMDIYRAASFKKFDEDYRKVYHERENAIKDRQTEIDRYEKRMKLAQINIDRSKDSLINTKEFAVKSNLEYVKKWLSSPFSQEITVNTDHSGITFKPTVLGTYFKPTEKTGNGGGR